MDTRIFLQAVLGDSGHYCSFASRRSDGRRTQQFHTSIDELLATTEQQDREGYDAYFALATFTNDQNRTQSNAAQLRSFFLDLDCGEGKDYATQYDAIAALRGLVEELTLPKPILVNSGFGVHAYWPLETPVAPSLWVPAAERLKATCRRLGVKTDESVTADSARVLRMPGTHNYKVEGGTPVHLFGRELRLKPATLQAFAAKLDEARAPLQTAVSLSDGNSAVMDALAGNRESWFRDIVVKTQKGRGCEQLRYMLTKPAEVDEPLWRAGLSIAKFCEDGKKAAHILSKGHPGYSVDETNEKLAGIKGPYLCSRFDDLNPGVCESCPNEGKVRSPISLGSRVAEAEPTPKPERGREDEEDDGSTTVMGIPEVLAARGIDELEEFEIPRFPRPYFRGRNGGVYLREDSSDGDADEKLIYMHDMYVVRRVDDPEDGESVLIRLHLPRDGVREFTMPLRVMVSREEAKRFLASKGVAALRMEDIMEYMMRWVAELQMTSEANQARRQFGWTDDAGTSFVLGDKEYFANRVRHNAPSATTAGLMRLFQPKGTLQGWKDMMAFYNREGFELHQYVALTGFASVLMRTANVSALGLHLWSKDSGYGKTTAMYAGATAWGNPKGLTLHESDTNNARMHRGEIYHNLPLYLDEITNMPPDQMSQLAYQISSGRQKARMKQGSNEERHQGEEWKLLVVTSGNTALHERIARVKQGAKAEAQRILEVCADQLFFSVDDKAATDLHSATVDNNYGHAGPMFLQYYMQHMDQIDNLVQQIKTRVDRAAGMTTQNRFWSEGPPRVLAAAIVLKRMGLIDYNVERLFNWSVEMLKTNKRNTEDMTSTCEEIVMDYVMDNWGNFIRINGGSTAQLSIPEVDPKVKLRGRYEPDTKKLYLAPGPLKAWCVDRQISYSELQKELMQTLGASRYKMRLTKGTTFQAPPTTVLAFKMDKDIEAEVESSLPQTGTES